MREAHNSKFKTQNSKLKIAEGNNSKFKTQNSKFKKESFCIPKRVLLHSKRSPFAHQNESFCKPKGVLLKNSPISLGKTILRFMVFPLSRNRESTIFAA